MIMLAWFRERVRGDVSGFISSLFRLHVLVKKNVVLLVFMSQLKKNVALQFIGIKVQLFSTSVDYFAFRKPLISALLLKRS